MSNFPKATQLGRSRVGIQTHAFDPSTPCLNDYKGISRLLFSWMLTILRDNTPWVKCGFGDPTEALLLAVPAVCWPEGLLYLKELVKLRLSMK